jgi:hypothetical protein
VFDSKWCVCVERSTTHAYIVDEGRFSAGIFGSHRKPSLHGGMQSPKKHGPERRQEGAATPRVRPHPGGPPAPPPSSGQLSGGPRPLLWWCLDPVAS